MNAKKNHHTCRMNAKIAWLASVWAGLGVTLGSAHAQDMAEGGSMAPTLDPIITAAFDLGLVPGFAVAVVKDDEVVYLRGFGWADVENERKVTPDTVFYIASSTKAFTGTAAAILDQRGELDLDAPLSVLTPALRLHEGLSADQITLRDLITHTHGIENSGPVSFRSSFSGKVTHELLMELLPRHGPAESGRAHMYGNIGHNITSLVMFEALGKRWQDILAAEIFEPLGMRSTTAYVSRIPEERLAMPYAISSTGFQRMPYIKGDSNMQAGVGMVTTASDLTRWLRAHLNEGRIGNDSVLNASAIAEAQRSHVEQANEFQQFQRTGYGLGWHTGSYDGDAFTHCFGSFIGFFSHISFMPEQGIGVIVLVNTSATGLPIADLVSRYIYDRLLEKPGTNERYGKELDQIKPMSGQFRERIAADADRRAARPQTLPHPLEAYAGVYENADYGEIEFSVVEGNRLETTMGRLWSEVTVYDNERNMLRVDLLGGGMVVTFDFEDSDQATALEFRGLRFDRVSPPPAAPQTTTTDDTVEVTDSIIELSDDEMELREAFNKAEGKVRLLLILSPTCGGCLRGARVVQENVLKKIDSDQLSVLVVWTPVLASDNRAAVDKASRTIADDRAAHFWDGDQSLGKTYGKIVQLPRGRSLAWDIYFAFDRDTRWNETVPEPDDWAHQLGGDARSLRNGDKLREAINRLLPDGGANPQPNCE